MRKPRRIRIEVKLQEEIKFTETRSFTIEKAENCDWLRLIEWDISGKYKMILDIRECNKKFILGFVDEISGMLIKIVEN